MIAVVDYGVGNLFSLCSSLKAIGADTVVTGDEKIIKSAEKIILPGVGAFGDAIKKLSCGGLDKVIKDEAENGKEIMGICLGMQLLFEKSFEYGEHSGLGLIKGQIVPMENRLPQGLKIPHIGWNGLLIKKESKLTKYIHENECVYFVHSYFGENCEEALVATAEYGREITAMVQNENVFGCQFHPEKSGKTGLNILKAFCED